MLGAGRPEVKRSGEAPGAGRPQPVLGYTPRPRTVKKLSTAVEIVVEKPGAS